MLKFSARIQLRAARVQSFKIADLQWFYVSIIMKIVPEHLLPIF